MKNETTSPQIISAEKFLETKPPLHLISPFDGYKITYSHLISLLEEFAKLHSRQLKSLPDKGVDVVITDDEIEKIIREYNFGVYEFGIIFKMMKKVRDKCPQSKADKGVKEGEKAVILPTSTQYQEWKSDFADGTSRQPNSVETFLWVKQNSKESLLPQQENNKKESKETFYFNDIIKLIEEYKKEELPNANEPFHHEAEISSGFKYFIEWLKRKQAQL